MKAVSGHRCRLIGQKAILGQGADTDYLVDGGSDLEAATRLVAASMESPSVQTMSGPYRPGSPFRTRYRVVSADEEVDVVIVASDEYDYVDHCYLLAEECSDLYALLREGFGKMFAYNAFGIALVPREWVEIPLP